MNTKKYKFDYTTKFKSCDLDEKEKKKFTLNLYLMSSELNILNKIICLEKLYDISRKEKDFQMMYHITHKILKYLKQGRIPIQYINIDNLFSYDFFNHNNEIFTMLLKQ